MKLGRLVLVALLAACGGDGASGSADAPPGNPDSAGIYTDLQRLEDLIAALPGAPDDAARGALVDAFVRTITYDSGGFPIRGAGVLAVIARDTAPLTLAGDFNAWSTTAHPLSAPVTGFAFQAVIAPDAGPDGRTGYKLVDGAGTHRADPLARRYAYDEFGELSLVDDGDEVHLERWPAFSGDGTLRPRDLRVLVPGGREEGWATRPPVLYAHDGQNLFDPAAPFGGWRALEAATGAAPFLLVGIDNTQDRMDEYTHVPDSIGGAPVGGEADAYVELLAAIKGHIGGRYPVRVDVAGHAVMGSSLGGLVSFYAALRRPDLFGTAISLSGTMGWGRFAADGPTIEELFVADPPTGTTLYLDSGGAASNPCETAGDDNYCENVALAARLRTLGWVDEDNLFYRHAEGGTHDEAAWAARLPAILTTVFPGPP